MDVTQIGSDEISGPAVTFQPAPAVKDISPQQPVPTPAYPLAETEIKESARQQDESKEVQETATAPVVALPLPPELYLNFLQQQMDFLRHQLGLSSVETPRTSITSGSPQPRLSAAPLPKESAGTNTTIFVHRTMVDATTNTTLFKHPMVSLVV